MENINQHKAQQVFEKLFPGNKIPAGTKLYKNGELEIEPDFEGDWNIVRIRVNELIKHYRPNSKTSVAKQVLQKPVQQPTQLLINQMVYPPVMQHLPNIILPEQVRYNIEAQRLMPAVVIQNPNYKEQIGEFVYDYVYNIVGENFAPKVTGMLVDLPMSEIRLFLQEHSILENRCKEAIALLNE